MTRIRCRCNSSCHGFRVYSLWSVKVPNFYLLNFPRISYGFPLFDVRIVGRWIAFHPPAAEVRSRACVRDCMSVVGCALVLVSVCVRGVCLYVRSSIIAKVWIYLSLIGEFRLASQAKPRSCLPPYRLSEGETTSLGGGIHLHLSQRAYTDQTRTD